MRFTSGGPDIPAELIAAQEAGELVILCGAGTSMPAGLPSFKQLVRRTYEALGECIEGDGPTPAEKLTFETNELDRTLRGLERRFVTAGPAGRAMARRIRDAVRAQLQPPTVFDATDHLALLALSRNDQHLPCLVTTNFDTLFERAAGYTGIKVMSAAGAGLPRPGTDRCEGVLHLHGRIADAECGLEESELILTSAEFGDAYLRDGWASQWLYDLARVATILLVGYRLEDPPVRYLLEALDFDRGRFADLRQVYALGPASDGNDDSIWRSKGVVPVLYSPSGDDTYGPLWKTIRDWATYARDPIVWARQRLAPLSTPYAPALEPLVGEAVTMFRRPNGFRLLGEIAPHPSWVEPLVKAQCFDAQCSPATWLQARMNDPDMARASLPLLPFDEWSTETLQRAIAKGEITNTGLAETWRLLLLGGRRRVRHSLERNRAEARLKRGAADYGDLKLIAEALRPRVRISKSWADDVAEALGGAEEPGTRSDRIVDVDMEIDDHLQFDNVVSNWSADAAATRVFVDHLTRTLADALEEARSVGFISDAMDRSAWDVPSIARHEQNKHRRGFYPMIRVIADAWEELLKLDMQAAKSVAARWSTQSEILFIRLFLHAGLNQNAVSTAEVARAVAALDRDAFWDGHTRLELMRLLIARMDDLSSTERAEIEARVREGPSIPEALSEEDLAQAHVIAKRAIFDRISRLKSAAVLLSADTEAALEKIRKGNPEWEERQGERSDFIMWSWSGSPAPTEISPLTETPIEDVLPVARRLREEDAYANRDVWQKFVSADPVRALAALKANGAAERWDGEAWKELLWAHTRDVRGARISDIAAALSSVPDEVISTFLPAAADWIEDAYQSEGLSSQEESALCELWTRVAAVEFARNESDADLSAHHIGDEVLQTAAGDLGEAVWRRLLRRKPAAGSGIPADVQPQLDAIMKAKGRSGVIARSALMMMAPWLTTVAPQWSEENLFPLLSAKQPQAAIYWSARSRHSSPGPVKLFNATIADLIEVFRTLSFDAHTEQRLFGLVLTPLIFKQRGQAADFKVSFGDGRTCLRRTSAETRAHVAWEFFQMLHQTEEAQRAALWRNEIRVLFEGIWPPDAALQNVETTSSVAAMAVETEDAFPEAVAAVLPFVFPGEEGSGFGLYRVRSDERDLIARFPGAVLTLLDAMVRDSTRAPDELREILNELETAAPNLSVDPRFVRLAALIRG